VLPDPHNRSPEVIEVLVLRENTRITHCYIDERKQPRVRCYVVVLRPCDIPNDLIAQARRRAETFNPIVCPEQPDEGLARSAGAVQWPARDGIEWQGTHKVWGNPLATDLGDGSIVLPATEFRRGIEMVSRGHGEASGPCAVKWCIETLVSDRGVRIVPVPSASNRKA
jgi:hypothetical protein